MAKAQTHYVFSFQQQIQKKTKTISVGYSELDNEARMVKVAEAKKYCKTLIKAHPSWGIERVIQNLEKNGFIKSVIRKKTGKQSVKEIIVLVKDLGHSNFKSHGGIVSTEQQHAFLYNLAKTKLNKQQQSLYDQLKANGIDFDNFNIRNKVENLYNDVKGDPKFDVLHDDFYKSETKNEDDDVTEVPESIFEGAKNAAMMDDNENVNDEDNGKDSDDDDEYDNDEYDNDDDNENEKKKKKWTVFDIENDIFGTVGNPFKRIVEFCFDNLLKKQQDTVLKIRVAYKKRFDTDPTDEFFEKTLIRFKETSNTRQSVLRDEYEEITASFPTTEFYKFLYEESRLTEFPLRQAKDKKSMRRLQASTNGKLRIQHPERVAICRLRSATSRFRKKGGQTNKRSLEAIGYNNMNISDKDAFNRLMNHAIADCNTPTKKEKEFDHGFAISRYSMLMAFAKIHKPDSIIATDDNSALLTLFQVDKNMFFLPWSMNAVKSNKFIFNIFIIFDPDDINNVIFKFRCVDGVYRTLCELIQKFSDDEMLSLDSKFPVVTQYWGCNIAATQLLSTDEEAAERTHRRITKDLRHYTNYGDFVEKEKNLDVRNTLDQLKRHIAFEKEMLEQENFTINKE